MYKVLLASHSIIQPCFVHSYIEMSQIVVMLCVREESDPTHRLLSVYILGKSISRSAAIAGLAGDVRPTDTLRETDF